VGAKNVDAINLGAEWWLPEAGGFEGHLLKATKFHLDTKCKFKRSW
jgi:hypothetical protein